MMNILSKQIFYGYRRGVIKMPFAFNESALVQIIENEEMSPQVLAQSHLAI